MNKEIDFIINFLKIASQRKKSIEVIQRYLKIYEKISIDKESIIKRLK